jgi:hypothetical protein
VDEERTIDLRELLDRLAKVGPTDVQQFLRMTVERVEQERARALEHVRDVADDEQRPDLSPFTPLAGDLDGELEHLLEGAAAFHVAVRARGDRAEDLLEVHYFSNVASRLGIPTKRKPSGRIAPVATSVSSSARLDSPSRCRQRYGTFSA